MKNNFDKAFIKKEKPNRKPWYVIKTKKWECHILLAFLIPIVMLGDALKEWAQRNRKWSTKRANRVLRYAFPNRAEVNTEERTIGKYIRSWWFSWSTYARWYDKKWCKKFNDKLKEYCIEEFEMEGYTKIVEIEDDEWTWVAFQKN